MSPQGLKRYVCLGSRLTTAGAHRRTDFNAGIGLVQMMGMTNYLALIGGGRNPKFAMNKACRF
jgi:hypothetical protein